MSHINDITNLRSERLRLSFFQFLFRHSDLFFFYLESHFKLAFGKKYKVKNVRKLSF